MKKYNLLSYLFLLFGFVLQAQQGNLFLNFSHSFDGQALVLGDEYSMPDGRKLDISRLDYYLSNLYLLKGDDLIPESISDSYLLIKDNSEMSVSAFSFENLDLTDVRGVRFYVGIDSVTNHEDPSVYSDGEPLALHMPSMHWGWAGGYRFVVVNGNVDHDWDETVDELMQFESVGDNFYQPFDLMFDQPQFGTIAMNITFHVEKLLEGLNLNAALIQHGSGANVNLMMDNVINNEVFTLDQSSLGIEEYNPEVELYFNGNNELQLQTNHLLKAYRLINTLGQIVQEGTFENATDYHSISLKELREGVYSIQLIGKDRSMRYNTMIVKR